MVSPKPLSRAGVVSHILRNRTTSPSTGVATDRWFHYDQVGSVLSESDAAGALAQTHHQDAFGNTQAAWQTGLWGGDRAGWHHNTKELDGDTGLVYMYQRWYAPETGTFMSSAPYPVTMEHRYGFAESNPVMGSDPKGEILYACAKRGAFGIDRFNHYFIYDSDADKSCGMNGSSGTNVGRQEDNQEYPPKDPEDPDKGDKKEDNPSHPNNPRVVCRPIETKSDCVNRAIMDCICDNKVANSGLYFPFINDCKSTARECIKENGAEWPNGLPDRINW
jgi:RHS repeat-associated protein